MAVINPFAIVPETEEDPTDLQFTLYGPIPILVPQEVIEILVSSIVKNKVETPVNYVGSIDHEIVIDGFLIGRYKKLFKRSLILLQQAQAGLSEFPIIINNREYTGSLPFATDMSFEIDMLIKSVNFGHAYQTKQGYRFRMTLAKERVATNWKRQLLRSAIRGGIIAAAPQIRALINFVSERNFSSFVESDLDLNRDLEGGWSVPLIPTIDPTPKTTSEIAEIPEELSQTILGTYDVNPNLAIGFDTSKTWLTLPILERSEYPQHWKLQNNSDIYEILLQIIPLKEEKYLKIRIKKNDEVLFSQRITEEGIVYKVDERRNSNGDAYFKLWFGFTKLDLRLTRMFKKGEDSVVNGVVYFES